MALVARMVDQVVDNTLLAQSIAPLDHHRPQAALCWVTRPTLAILMRCKTKQGVVGLAATIQMVIALSLAAEAEVVD